MAYLRLQFVLLLSCLAMTFASSFPDFLAALENQNNEVQPDPIDFFAAMQAQEPSIGTPCTMDVQTTQKIAGKCVKLGRNTHGCVAGSYIHPFHGDCFKQ